MKRFWVDLRPWNKACATTAIESGADAVIADDPAAVRELGRVPVVAADGDLVFGKDVFFVDIDGTAGQEEAAERARQGLVVVTTHDWSVIPLENLVAASDRIIARVASAAEAEVALGVLERGVAGVCLATGDPAEIRRVAALVRRMTEPVPLTVLEVTRIVPAGMGDRVCVDTCSLLADGQGMLVGNTSGGFLLVHAETLQNPYVDPRPFRVNAGAVHAYLLMPNGKTAYLADLKAGDTVLVVDTGGQTTEAVVGRVKIERRPLLLVEASAGGIAVGLVLQNAETIRLVREDGTAVSVVDLAVGDRLLGHATGAGRHFGMAVKETIVER
ncbi:MAG: 3-dehydroquinate synthase II [Methanomicrobiales archaeon]|nr:3-dehydroquinate synthase II [Methanomicrobiales archaeon]